MIGKAESNSLKSSNVDQSKLSEKKKLEESEHDVNLSTTVVEGVFFIIVRIRMESIGRRTKASADVKGKEEISGAYPYFRCFRFSYTSWI